MTESSEKVLGVLKVLNIFVNKSVNTVYGNSNSNLLVLRTVFVVLS